MRNKQKGFSLIELLIVVAIILIIAAIAIPNLLRSKMAANEASAVASLRTYNTSIVAYQTTYGTDPDTSFAQLGPVTGGAAPSASAADLVDSLLGIANPAIKSGFSFTYTAVAATPVTQYTILAVPQSTSTGQRKFFTDQSGVIRQTVDGTTPTVTSLPIGG
jgi:prepilin-type N-terminal cleavage/methylation domain-containing protein